MTRSEELFERALKRIPGGVNSPVRAFGQVGCTPRFIKSANGAYMTDADDNTYLDFVGSWGPMILGHNHPVVKEAVLRACEDGLSYGAACEKEVIMAEMMCDIVPGLEMVRMVNSGTEAVMSAIRAARGYTRRDKIVKFMGCYHGHSDALLVKAGSGVMTAGIPDSLGVPKGCTQDTLGAVYNDLDSVRVLFEDYKDQIAAIIVEPVAANMGTVLPQEGFLKGLRDLCDENGAVLIFDEVITGFRLSLGGAQEFFGINADLVTFGKIIGAGMPVGAYGGKKEIMEMVSPLGSVYQAGTLSGNPVAMSAGIAQLKLLSEDKDLYKNLNKKADAFFDKLGNKLKERNAKAVLNHIGSLGSVFFTDVPVVNYETAKTSDTVKYGEYFRFMLESGIYLAPAQFEAMFISNAHTEEELERVLSTVDEYLSR